MNVAFAILFGLMVAVIAFPLAPFWIPTIALYVLGRCWLTLRGRIAGESGDTASSVAHRFQSLTGWVWRSALIFVLPLDIIAFLSAGPDPWQEAWALAKVLIGWMLAGVFSLDAVFWSLRHGQPGRDSEASKRIYQQITAEFERGSFDQDIWIKSLKVAGGDYRKAQGIYTTGRAAALMAERKPAPGFLMEVPFFIAFAAVVLIWALATDSGETTFDAILHGPTAAVPPPNSARQAVAAPVPPSQSTLPSTTSSSKEQLAKEMFKMGMRYEKGDGMPQDYNQAVTWFRRGADQGDAEAQNALGVMYQAGQSVAQDYGQALSWYQKAAGQGLAAAQYNIAGLYFHGQGVPQDYSQSFVWCQKAAEQGDAEAQTSMGVMYQNGQGVAKDDEQAYSWFAKAADQGYAGAENSLAGLYFNKQDYSQALGWYQKAAEQGDTGAQNNMGAMYAAGKGVPQDFGQAFNWFSKAASQGNADAQFKVGIMCETGTGVAQDKASAVSWYKKAAAQGQVQAQAALARLGD